MLGFQYLHAEVDDRILLKSLFQLFFRYDAGRRERSEKSIQVLVWHPDIAPFTNLVQFRVPSKLFPLMLVEQVPVSQSHRAMRVYGFDAEPTYVIDPVQGYLALDQFLNLLDHYLLVHESVWETAWKQVPVPDCDGSVKTGFTITAADFSDQVLIGRQWMRYHK